MRYPLRRFFVPVLALIISVGAVATAAQTKSSSKSSTSKTKTTATTKKETSKYRRLPTYYGQLELKEEQITDIYEIKDTFGPKIDDLEKQIEKLKEDQDKKIKDVLTRTQVTALNKLVAGTAKKESSSSKSSSSKSTEKKSTSSSSSSSKKK